MATVRAEHCRGRHKVPICIRTTVDFGEWFGPRMRTEDILFHIEADGREPHTMRLENAQYSHEWIEPGDTLVLAIRVKPW